MRLAIWLDQLLGALAGIALLLACAATLLRYSFASIIPDWADEVVITLLIWAMFLTGYRMTLERSHIAVDLLTHGRSLRRRRALGIVATLGLTAFGLLLAGSGVLVVIDAVALGERTESTLRLPTALYFASLPIGMALLVAAAIIDLRRWLRGETEASPASEEQAL